MFPFYKLGQPLTIIAHRAGAGLWPENTVFAMQEAFKLGVNLCEIDLHMTRDGVIVAIHDDTVERTTNGHGKVKDLTYIQLKSLDSGYRWTNDKGKTYPYRGKGLTIPSLAEIFTQFPQQLILLDLKQQVPSIIAALQQLIDRYKMEKKVVITAFSDEIIRIYRRLYPHIPSAAQSKEIRKLIQLSRWRLEKFYTFPAESLVVQFSRITPRFIETAHRKNKRVDVWTVDDITEMKRLIGLGVDGILTDYPDRLLSLRT